MPTFFLGNYEVGLEWWSDENLNWESGNGGRPIELERVDDESILRVSPVSAPVRNLSRFDHRFALFPVPMRPSRSCGARWGR